MQGKTSGRGKNKVFTGNASGSISLEIPGIQQVSKDLASVTNALQELKSTLQGMSSAFTAGPIVNMLSQISRTAVTTTQSLNGLSTAVAGASRPGGGGGGGGRANMAMASAPMGGGGAGGAGFYNSMTASAGARNTQSTSGAGASLGQTIGGVMGNASKDLISSIPIVGGLAGGLMEFAGDMAMFPLRFARERVNKNRAASYTMAGDLTPYQWSTGKDMSSLMSSIKNIPGNMQGDVNDVLDALNIGRKSGAAFGFGGQGGARSNQFYNTVSDFQKITPGLGAGKVAAIVGNQLSNTQSQQASAFYTGGAFSMVGAGGSMKSASAWAEGIMKWLEGQRPGKYRGKSFNYGELLGQQFPGSNINAWFDTVGISAEMKDYWWSWALAKTQMNVGGDKVFDSMDKKLGSNQAWRKANADTALTRNEFGLAGQMTGQYATRERSNQWFNQAMGAAVNRMVPGMSKGALGMMQYLPDEVDQFLWNTLESAGPLAQIVGGGIGWQAAAQGMATGDLGDLGDGGYGAYGGTGTAGLNPDIKSKVARMMKANPRLKVTSGLRDKYTSAKLQRKGIGNFGSGTPFMGDVGDGRVNRHSPHSAGWAADLGPRSEYGWIQKNAHKFGLQTAANHGEPWHVQNAGTISGGGGPIGRGRIGDPGGDVGDWYSFIPGADAVASVVGAVGDGIEMLAKLLNTVFGAVGAVKDMATGGGILDMTGAGPDKVTGKVSQFMSMMGLGAGKGNAADTVIGYDAKFAAGLPTTINLDENSWRGTPGAAAGGLGAGSGGGGGGGGSVSPASVQRILQKYAGGNSVQAQAVTPAIQAKMMVALRAAAATGLSGDELVAAVSLAGRESGFNPLAHNGNAGSGDNSYGLWQINMLGAMGDQRRKALGISSNDELFDPNINAKAMKQLFDGNKTPFYAWGPYRGDAPLHGGAEDWVPAVYSVAKSEGFVGDPGMDYQAAGGGGRMTAVQFNNTFHISGGAGPTGGLDIGRMVPMMADRLEDEMKKRLAVTR